jgi:methionine synthase I (cobalamin-dependent)
MGAPVDEAMAAAIAAGADVVGANCGNSLDLADYKQLARQLVAAARQPSSESDWAPPVILQPNAGAPRLVGDQAAYPSRPEDMAAIVPSLLRTGVRVIGGCCGTTPDHMRSMGAALRGAASG